MHEMSVHEYNTGVKFLEKNKHLKSLPYLKRSLKHWPFKECYLNMANAYKYLGDDAKAGQNYVLANNKHIPFSDGKFVDIYDLAVNNLGLMAYKYEHDDLAVEFFKQAMFCRYKTTAESESSTLFNLSIARLRQYCSGKYNDPRLAWKMYKSRFNSGKNPSKLKGSKKDLIEWNGIDRSTSIVVMAEQGFGDSLMFMRYVSRLREYFDRVWIQCDLSTVGLFTGYDTCFDTIETDATHGVAFGDLAFHFWEEIPSGKWLGSVRPSRGSDLRIGCVWSGNIIHANNRYRSTVPGYFKRLSKFGTLHTLNPTEHGEKGFISMGNKTWSETLEAVGKLDVVVAVDTSIVHLCGSAGVPCLALMPLMDTDFRWGDSSMGTRNVWYDSVKVIRNPNSWEKVFDKVEIELANRIAS